MVFVSKVSMLVPQCSDATAQRPGHGDVPGAPWQLQCQRHRVGGGVRGSQVQALNAADLAGQTAQALLRKTAGKLPIAYRCYLIGRVKFFWDQDANVHSFFLV